MGRLIVVSNRLPITVRVEHGVPVLGSSSGGLVSGLIRHHECNDTLWVGYPGERSGVEPERLAELDAELGKRRIVPVWIESDTYRRFYDGFANGVIWPVFHYLTGKLPLWTSKMRAYEAANQQFADAIAAVYRPGDLVWIHDYQLMRVPHLLRARVPSARIGFFLHIPFPTAEVFRILPGRRELLEGALGADLIGFHTSAYLRHFAVAATHLLGARVDLDRVDFGGRDVRLGVFPMGIDAAHYRDLAADPEAARLAEEFRGDGRQRVLAAIDRLDYTKGMPQRLVAYERLLQSHPELRGVVKLVMVAVPSRERVGAYRGLRTTVNRLIGRIHGQYATPSWSPVHYLYRNLSALELAGLYRAADVMLVTPLRDGMNLVAKEFVASRVDGDGTLVLSEFAGASSELVGALMVNPYDADGMARVFHQALTLDPATRRQRMELLRHRVFEYDVHRWANEFRAALGQAAPRTRVSHERIPTPGQVHIAVNKLKSAKRLVLFLDYDGTLVPFAPSPELALPDAELTDLLGRLAKRPRTDVYLVSGRSRGFLERWFGDLKINLTAEHGAESRAAGETEWVEQVHPVNDWRERVRPALTDFTNRTPGSFVELKRFGVAWHWRAADPDFGARQARELMVHLDQLLSNAPVESLVGNRVVELRPLGANKGLVVKRVVEQIGLKAEYLALGDDTTDRELFQALPDDAVSIQVGDGPSIAALRVETPTEARRVLAQLLEK